MKQLLIIMMTFLVGFHNPIQKNEKREVEGQVTDVVDGKVMPNVLVYLKGSQESVSTDSKGNYKINVPGKAGTLVFRFVGYQPHEERIGKRKVINVKLRPDTTSLGEVISGTAKGASRKLSLSVIDHKNAGPEALYEDSELKRGLRSNFVPVMGHQPSGESYKEIEENTFKSPWKNPYSTFSIDVDAASYSNVRRFLNQGQLPPKDAVKIEEMINYFNYDYEGPSGKKPFEVHQELSSAPWNSKHQLLHIGLQGKRMETDDLPASNLVFLIDVSGSMSSQNKLPLLKSAFKLLTNQLREQDRVAIVVYAGAAGEVLPSTPGNERQKIKEALNSLNAGGSTAGGAGIQLAYKIAKKNFIKNGNNRIILATDGDFNVGASSDKAMEDLIEEKRKEGVFLTALGFGMGNYKDSKMEVLADKGNGNHAYIDNILEAKKVLVNEFGGTLFTIAKDVKLQVEFNPATVQAYRLIGYENRKLADEDFNNDKKDAGELGAGHSVTALYEIIPVGVESSFKPLDDLKYQNNKPEREEVNMEDLVTIKLRYKAPDSDKSNLIEEVVKNYEVHIDKTSNNFRWSAAVASFGMLLRDSDYCQDMSFDSVMSLARRSKGKDFDGYRAEFIKLVETAQLLD